MPAESPTSCSTCHMPYFTAVLGGAARTNLGALWLVRNKAMCFIQRYTFKKSLHERVCESDCSDRRGDHTCDGWSLEASQRHLMQCSWSTRQMASQCMTLSWPGVRCSRYGHVSLTLVKRAAFTSAKDPNSGLEVQRPDKPQSNIDTPPLV